MIIGLITSLVLAIVFFVLYLNKTNNKNDIKKKKTKGKVIKSEYSKLGDIVYIIELKLRKDIVKAKSIRYAKEYKRLKKDSVVDVEYYSSKKGNLIVEILDNDLVPCAKEEPITLVLSIACFFFSIVFLINILKKYTGDFNNLIIFAIIGTLILICCFLPSILIGLKVVKKGKIVKALIIKKELVENKSSDNSAWKDIRMQFNIEVEVEGKKLNRLFAIDSYTENLKIGDEINIIMYKKYFTLEKQGNKKKEKK